MARAIRSSLGLPTSSTSTFAAHSVPGLISLASVPPIRACGSASTRVAPRCPRPSRSTPRLWSGRASCPSPPPSPWPPSALLRSASFGCFASEWASDSCLRFRDSSLISASVRMALAANFRGKAAGTRPPEDQSQGFRHDRTENTGNCSQLPVHRVLRQNGGGDQRGVSRFSFSSRDYREILHGDRLYKSITLLFQLSPIRRANSILHTFGLEVPRFRRPQPMTG